MPNDLAIVHLVPDPPTGQIARIPDGGIVTSVPAGDPDELMIRLWLHGRSANTQDAYRRAITRFQAAVPLPLKTVSLAMLQAWSDCEYMAAMAPATRGLQVAAVKSLFAWATKGRFLPWDVSIALKSPRLEDTLTERILPEADILRIIKGEKNKRNSVLLWVLYASGMRVSEPCALTWANCVDRANGAGQLAIFGKGRKTRFVLLPRSVWTRLMSLKTPEGAEPEFGARPVFVSRQGGALTRQQIWNIVGAAARRVGITAPVSPHWFRHAFASHGLDRGAPISLVQAALGHASQATTGRYTHARPGIGVGDFLGLG
jgi:integrase/recombinase XerD